MDGAGVGYLFLLTIYKITFIYSSFTNNLKFPINSLRRVTRTGLHHLVYVKSVPRHKHRVACARIHKDRNFSIIKSMKTLANESHRWSIFVPIVIKDYSQVPWNVSNPGGKYKMLHCIMIGRYDVGPSTLAEVGGELTLLSSTRPIAVGKGM